MVHKFRVVVAVSNQSAQLQNSPARLILSDLFRLCVPSLLVDARSLKPRFPNPKWLFSIPIVPDGDLQMSEFGWRKLEKEHFAPIGTQSSLDMLCLAQFGPVLRSRYNLHASIRGHFSEPSFVGEVYSVKRQLISFSVRHFLRTAYVVHLIMMTCLNKQEASVQQL